MSQAGWAKMAGQPWQASPARRESTWLPLVVGAQRNKDTATPDTADDTMNRRLIKRKQRESRAAGTAVAVAGAARRRPSRSRSTTARRPPLGQPPHLWPVISELRRQAASAQGLVLTVETANPGSPLPRPQEPRPRGTVAVQLFAESLLAATAPKPREASMLSSEERAALPWRSSSSASSNSAPRS